MYQFEGSLSTVDAGHGDTGRHAFVALEGGFGKLRLGKSNGAVQNHAGGVRNQAYWESSNDSLLGTRYNAMAYSISTGPVSMQVDAMMSDKDTGSAIDGAALGMSVALGDYGKVAIGYENMKDVNGTMMMDVTSQMGGTQIKEDGTVNTSDVVWRDKMKNVFDPGNNPVKITHMVGSTSVEMMKVYFADDEEANLNTAAASWANIKGKVYFIAGDCVTDGDIGTGCDGKDDADATEADSDEIKSTYVWVSSEYVVDVHSDSDSKGMKKYTVHALADGTAGATTDALAAALVSTATVTLPDMDYGSKKSHISAEFGLGAVTVGLGYSSQESNEPGVTGKAKTTYLGAQGGFGDTGISWFAWSRNKESYAGKETEPWALGVNKSLGDGAFTFLEHANDDDGAGGRTHVALGVNF